MTFKQNLLDAVNDAVADAEMMSVSDWIDDLGTHTIMDNAGASEDFRKETGEEPCWGEGYSQESMQAQIGARGKGGDVTGPEGMMFISTIDIAEACADKYVPQPWHHGKMGMGFAVDACVEAIKEAGH